MFSVSKFLKITFFDSFLEIEILPLNYGNYYFDYDFFGYYNFASDFLKFMFLPLIFWIIKILALYFLEFIFMFLKVL